MSESDELVRLRERIAALERRCLTLIDAVGQGLTFDGALKDGTARSEDGSPDKATSALSYADLQTQDPQVVLKDFAGNSVTLRGNEKAPKVTITNTDKTGSVTQAITLSGAGSDAWISIADNQNNTIKLDKSGIVIKSADNSDTITLDSNGVKVEGANITLTGSATIKATGTARSPLRGRRSR